MIIITHTANVKRSIIRNLRSKSASSCSFTCQKRRIYLQESALYDTKYEVTADFVWVSKSQLLFEISKKHFSYLSRPFSNQRSPDRERAMHNVGGAQHLASGIIGQMCYISKSQISQLPGEALSNDLIGEVLSTYEACSKSFRALQRTTCSDLPWTSTIP